MPKKATDALKEILKKDTRYTAEAYGFIFETLDFTIKEIGKRRHVSGQELLKGIRQYAIKQFGMLAKMVFNSWGIYKTDDFGELVFNLVDAGLMGKTDEDNMDNFKNGYDFNKAFGTDQEGKEMPGSARSSQG